MTTLPLVLLGLRSSWKPDLSASPTLLVYRKPLRLPGELFSPPEVRSSSEFVAELQNQMDNIQAMPPSFHLSPAATPSDNVLRRFLSCDHAYVRIDAVKPPLTKPYSGPFKILRKTEKYFELDLNGRRDKVSIDRLKPAFIETETEREKESRENSEQSDPAIICYGPNTKTEDEEKLTEISPSETTQPLIARNKRGRPSREVLDERRRLANEEQRLRPETPINVTRSGRQTRPPDRL